MRCLRWTACGQCLRLRADRCCHRLRLLGRRSPRSYRRRHPLHPRRLRSDRPVLEVRSAHSSQPEHASSPPHTPLPTSSPTSVLSKYPRVPRIRRRQHQRDYNQCIDRLGFQSLSSVPPLPCCARRWDRWHGPSGRHRSDTTGCWDPHILRIHRTPRHLLLLLPTHRPKFVRRQQQMHDTPHTDNADHRNSRTPLHPTRHPQIPNAPSSFVGTSPAPSPLSGNWPPPSRVR